MTEKINWEQIAKEKSEYQADLFFWHYNPMQNYFSIFRKNGIMQMTMVGGLHFTDPKLGRALATQVCEFLNNQQYEEFKKKQEKLQLKPSMVELDEDDENEEEVDE